MSATTTIPQTLISARSIRAARPAVTQRVWMRCPQCSSPLGAILYDLLSSDAMRMRCSNCSFCLSQEAGIWMALPPARREYFAQFVHEYETVRASEGRGCAHPAFYLALPHEDRTGRNGWQWKIRSRSFRFLEQNILPRIAQRAQRELFCLDLGAGNGWLSFRLAQLGHIPIAVDLLTNSFDGLGAAKHYDAVLSRPFPRFQAELDHLPFGHAQFDCAIFSASFHYSENYERTLSEAIRCLRPGGTVLIVDSPWYSCEESGQVMLRERRAQFLYRYGFSADSLSSSEYLTDERLARLERLFNIRWVRHQPWYGLRWALRPAVARWKHRREPSIFRIYSAEVGIR